MNMVFRAGAALAAASLLSGCATVVRGTKTSYQITSTPSEAEVALSTGETCVTPCKLKLKRKNGFTATISKSGYKPHIAKVESKLSGGGGAAVAGNVLLGGIIGGVVDGANGSMNSFFPSSLSVLLEPLRAAMAAEPAPAEAPPATGGN